MWKNSTLPGPGGGRGSIKGWERGRATEPSLWSMLIQTRGHKLLTCLLFFLIVWWMHGTKNTWFASDIGEVLCAFRSMLHKLSVIVRQVGLFDSGRPIATQLHSTIQHHVENERSVSFCYILQLTGTGRFALIIKRFLDMSSAISMHFLWSDHNPYALDLDKSQCTQDALWSDHWNHILIIFNAGVNVNVVLRYGHPI